MTPLRLARYCGGNKALAERVFYVVRAESTRSYHKMGTRRRRTARLIQGIAL